MPSALVRKMIEQYAYPVLDEDTIDGFLDDRKEVVLFFTENPQQFPESDDVAMILPELVKHFDGRLQAAVISQDSQHKLQRRFGFSSWPALVFMRNNEYLGTITQVQNWDDYLRDIGQMLESEPLRAPGFSIPVVTRSASNCH